MKFITNNFITLPALTLLIASLSPACYARTSLDSIAAVVNDDIITLSEFELRLNEFRNNIESEFANASEEHYFRMQVLKRVISDRIQLQLAKRQGIRIDDISLNRTLRKIAAQNNMTLDDLSKALKKEGIDYERFREQTRNKILIQKIQQRMVMSRIKITEQEISRFIEHNRSGKNNEEYELRHILIAIRESASPDDIKSSRIKADLAVNEIQSGKSFHDIAVRMSNGANALSGGKLGWRKASELPDLFVKAARQLQVGETSKPLKSASGFHIINLVNKKTERHMIKQTLARHILIKPDAITDDESARLKITNIRSQIIDGRSFEALAKEFSQDTGSGNNGGELGWSSPGQYVAIFEQVLNQLDIGALSKPFRSEFGWHIIEVLDRRNKDDSKSVRRNRARAAIMKQKADEELRLWLRRIRDEAYVELKPPFTNSLDE